MPTLPRTLRTVGSVCALVALAASLFDIGLSMAPGWGPSSVPTTTAGWLEQLSGEPWLGVRNLDLLNAGVSLVMAPMFLALSWTYLRRSPALAGLGLVFALIGATLFVGNNVALPMLDLGTRYATSHTITEGAPLLAAADSLLARGQHGSFGAAPGFLISELGTLLVALSMWSVARTRWLAVTGSGGAMLLAGYTVWSLVTPAPLALAAVGGIAMIVWLGGVATLLLRSDFGVNDGAAA